MTAPTLDLSGRTVLLTGATGGIAGAILDGIGGEGVHLVLHGRDADALGSLADALRARIDAVTTVVVDLAHDAASVAETIADAADAIDVLINNAGVYPGGNALETDEDTIETTFAINALAPWALTRAVLPGMNRRGRGRVVNVSSGGGSFGEGLDPGHAAYAVSKAALNAVTILAAGEARGDVKVNAMCPGWVRTRMGGQGAPRSPERGADTALWLAGLGIDGPNGGFFRDREPIPW